MKDTEEFTRDPENDRKESRFERDWTKGNIVRNLLSLAWPMMVGSGLNMFGPTIDMIWVGRLGVASVAGVGVAGMAVMLMNSMRMGLYTGLRAMIARFIGADDNRSANHVAQQAFVVGASFSTFIALVGIFFAEAILSLLGLEADVIVAGTAYMRIQFIGAIFMSLRMITESTMQASGDAVTPMKIAIVYRVFHVILCPFLIFGWWIFPRMGVSGAAMTNVASQFVGGGLGLWVLFSGNTRMRLTLKNFNLDGNMIWRIVKIGIPASVSSMERGVSQAVMLWFMTSYGTLSIAAHTICSRADMMVSMAAMGIGQAAGVLAGQNLGANQPGQAEKACWIAAGIGEGLMISVSLAIFISPQTLAYIFTPDPELVEVTSVFLRIMMAYFLVEGLRMVFMRCLNDVGDTVPPMLVAILSMWLIQIPLAYFLPKMTDLGVLGVRWAMAIGTIAQVIAYVTYFRLGRWKRKKV
ncbi:MATE family efflux transporter [Chloroflexota bacterium]